MLVTSSDHQVEQQKHCFNGGSWKHATDLPSGK